MAAPQPERRYGVDELAALTGVTQRTLRYYIQIGLVDRPIGETRAAYYTAHHLEQLLTVRKWTEAGLALESIRRLMSGDLPATPPEPRGQIEVRSHLMLASGVELVVDPGRAGLKPAQLRRFFRDVQSLYDTLIQEKNDER